MASKLVIAEKFGWTLDYIDSLDNWTISSIMGVMDGWQKVDNHRAEKARQKARSGRRR